MKRLLQIISLALLVALLPGLVPTSGANSATILNTPIEPLKIQPGDTFKADVQNLEELKIKEVKPDEFAFKSLSGDLIEIGEERHSPPQPYLALNKWDRVSKLECLANDIGLVGNIVQKRPILYLGPAYARKVNLASTNFVNGATLVKLTKSGQSDIKRTSVVVVSAPQITCIFDLTGAATGRWSEVKVVDDIVSKGDTGELPLSLLENNLWCLKSTGKM